MHWYLLSADSRPFLRHLTLPPLSPDTYESLVLAYLGIFLFDTDHLDIADRSAIDIWPSLPCLQTRTSLTCISIPRNLFFLDANFIFFWCVYHVEILDSSIEVQGNIFLMQINFYFDTYGDIFFDAFLFFLILHPGSQCYVLHHPFTWIFPVYRTFLSLSSEMMFPLQWCEFRLHHKLFDGFKIWLFSIWKNDCLVGGPEWVEILKPSSLKVSELEPHCSVL